MPVGSNVAIVSTWLPLGDTGEVRAEQVAVDAVEPTLALVDAGQDRLFARVGRKVDERVHAVRPCRSVERTSTSTPPAAGRTDVDPTRGGRRST